jgi:dCMP deaminase
MRLSWDRHFMNIALEVASMGTCARRQVGAIAIDSHHFILSTGMNGVPPKFEHCRDNPRHACPGANLPSGTGLDACLATHAEINMLIHCSDISRVHTVYCTSSPCISCVKALLCTNAMRIVFMERYPHYESEELWTRHHLEERDRAGTLVRSWFRTWEQLQEDGSVKVFGSSELRK